MIKIHLYRIMYMKLAVNLQQQRPNYCRTCSPLRRCVIPIVDVVPSDLHRCYEILPDGLGVPLRLPSGGAEEERHQEQQGPHPLHVRTCRLHFTMSRCQTLSRLCCVSSGLTYLRGEREEEGQIERMKEEWSTWEASGRRTRFPDITKLFIWKSSLSWRRYNNKTHLGSYTHKWFITEG